MINDDLNRIDNPLVRQLAETLGALAGVRTVRFFPPIEPWLIEHVGADAMIFAIFASPPEGDPVQFWRVVPASVWGDESKHGWVVKSAQLITTSIVTTGKLPNDFGQTPSSKP